jgi:hypothetical protein
VLVSAYPGILFRHQLEGMLDRSGVDLLCLNAESDAELYRQACTALDIDGSNAVVTGLPILWPLQPRLQVPDGAAIVFFEQPSVPDNPIQRKYICRRLADLAKAWPQHPVIFKPRTSPVEATLHRHHGEMASRVYKLSRRIDNVQISYMPSLSLLKRCGCAITVSSTAAAATRRYRSTTPARMPKFKPCAQQRKRWATTVWSIAPSMSLWSPAPCVPAPSSTPESHAWCSVPATPKRGLAVA